MAQIFPLPSCPLGAPGLAKRLPGRSDAVERSLLVSASDQDLQAALAAIGLDAIDPLVIEPALRDLLLRYARLLEAPADSNILRGRRADIRGYVAWAQERGLAPIPATGDGLCTQIEGYLTAIGATYSCARRRNCLGRRPPSPRTPGHQAAQTARSMNQLQAATTLTNTGTAAATAEPVSPGRRSG